MAELKCVACHKPNRADDRFCAACGSSLDLKLCPACEAVNNPVADRCHNCGKALGEPPETAEVETLVTAVEVQPPPFHAPRRWQTYDARPTLARRLGRYTKWSLLVGLPIAGAAAWALQHHHLRLPSAGTPAPQAATAAAEKNVAAVAGPLAPALVEKVRKPPAVQVRQAGAKSKAATPAAAVAAGKVVPTDIAAPPVAQPGRVTHTRAAPAFPAESSRAVVGTGAASAAAPAKRPAEDCAPPVAALGMCSNNVKGEGN